MGEADKEDGTSQGDLRQEGGACGLGGWNSRVGMLIRRGFSGACIVLSPALSQCCAHSQHSVNVG